MTYLSYHGVESTGALKDTYKAAIQFENSQSSWKIDESTK